MPMTTASMEVNGNQEEDTKFFWEMVARLPEHLQTCFGAEQLEQFLSLRAQQRAEERNRPAKSPPPTTITWLRA